MKQHAIRFLLAAAAVAVLVQPAAAQGARSAKRPVEIGFNYGYAWTGSQGVDFLYNGDWYSGDVDIEDGDYWGVNLDVGMAPGMYGEFIYRNQTSDLTFKSRGTGTVSLTELSVNYWQLGALRELKQGRVRPFTAVSLGGTYVTAKAVDESAWYFSAILALGAKVDLNERAALRLQANLPITFTGGGLAFGVGTGGASAGFYGTGVTQFDLSAGVSLKF